MKKLPIEAFAVDIRSIQYRRRRLFLDVVHCTVNGIDPFFVSASDRGSTLNSSKKSVAGLTNHANEVGRCKSNGCLAGHLGNLATLGERLVRGHLEGGPSVGRETIRNVGEMRLFSKWQRP